MTESAERRLKQAMGDELPVRALVDRRGPDLALPAQGGARLRVDDPELWAKQSRLTPTS